MSTSRADNDPLVRLRELESELRQLETEARRHRATAQVYQEGCRLFSSGQSRSEIRSELIAILRQILAVDRLALLQRADDAGRYTVVTARGLPGLSPGGLTLAAPVVSFALVTPAAEPGTLAAELRQHLDVPQLLWAHHAETGLALILGRTNADGESQLPFAADDQETVEGVLKMFTVLQRGEQAEGALAESERRYRLSEEKYRSVAEHSLQAMTIGQGVPGRIVYANPAAARLLGYPVEEMQDLSPGKTAALIHRADQPLFLELYLAHLRDQAPESRYEIRGVRKDGSVRWLEVRSSYFEYEGEPAVLGTFVDITERRQAEAALREALEELDLQNRELKKLDRMKDGLIRDVSHELKTPVAMQAMQLEILKSLGMRHEDSDRVHRVIESMERALRRQQHVIRNILELSRLEEGGRTYKQEPVQLDELLARVLADYREVIEARNLAVVAELPAVRVTSDGGMLWHVFSNLVNNAVKFSPAARGARLAVRLGEAPSAVVVEVADEGVGLTSEELEQVFDRFFQATATVEGCGVGLTICQLIVEGLGGRISLDSRGRDQGTTVTVVLPRDET